MPFDQVGGGQLHQALVADVLAQRYRVDLIHHAPGFTHEQLRRDYGLEAGRVSLRYVDPFPARWPYLDPGRKGIRPAFRSHRHLTAGYDLFVNVVMGPPIRCYARRGILLVLFPEAGRREIWPWNDPAGASPLLKKIIRNAYYARRWRQVFGSYRGCLANSRFTAVWIKARWGIDAEVVYPPVRARFEVRPKERLILSVGRFSRYGTQKKQLEMVQAFTRVVASLPAGWEYLCLGGVSNDPHDQQYYRDVCQAASGYPVRVVANPLGTVVKDAYERAALFWHAAGLGEDEQAHPERTEHFGMSTVEAMAAGCVPLVIRKGGQPEIVADGRSGYLWDSLDDLIDRTRRLALTPDSQETMATEARVRARTFTDPQEFAARFIGTVTALVGEPASRTPE